MLSKSTFLALSLLSIHGSTLPVDAPPPPPLPALAAPVACRQGPSISSSIAREYTTVEDLVSSLPDQEEIKEDEDNWLETDDACFISAENMIEAIPADILAQIPDDDNENNLQGRWLGVAIRVVSQVVKAVGKNTGKGARVIPRVCKRAGGACGAWAAARGITQQRFNEIKDLLAAKRAENTKLIETTGDFSQKLMGEVGCLSKVSTLFDRYGFDIMNLMIAGSTLSPGRLYNDFLGKGNADVLAQLKKVYDDFSGNKPGWDTFREEVSDFLQHCKGGKIPTKNRR